MSNAQPQKPILRYHDGKWRIAPWILDHFPPHRVYVEPFCGAASVLLRKPPSEVEVINDKNGRVINLFRVLRDAQCAEKLRHMIEYTPYSHAEYMAAREPADDPIEDARRMLVLNSVQGSVVLSGYPSDLYDRELYKGWRRVEWTAVGDNSSIGREVLWISPNAQLPQGTLF